MPSILPNSPSLQTGCLKSYLDSRFKGNKELKVRTYSAHLSVQLRAFGASYDDKKTVYEGRGELLWFTILLRRFNFIKKKNYRSLVLKLTKRIDKLCKTKGTNNVVSRLDRATVDFINEDLAPNLSKKELNIVGFSLTNEQLYASLYCYLYLLKHYPEYRMLFVFGGGITSWPGILKVLKKFDVKGLVVIGEGEVKLEKIIKACLKGEVSKLDKINDVYYVSKLTDEDIFKLRPTEGSQLKSIEDLPLPDYTEYFNTLREYCEDESLYLNLKRNVLLLIEGSRGCSWGKCDFCDRSASIGCYRKKTPEKILQQLESVLKKYKPDHIQFSDTLCDPWVGKFSELLLDQGTTCDTAFELRSTHPESFYTKLSLMGCRTVQVGIESLSETLLKKMNKGSDLISNIQTMKYLKELKIKNFSNIMIDHPKSNINEVKETKKILDTLPHLEKLQLTRYTLMENSPIYNDLSLQDRKTLKQRNIIDMAALLFSFFTDNFVLPRVKDLPNKVKKTWNDFVDWYDEWKPEEVYLNVYRISSDTILIKDTRHGSTKDFILDGSKEKIYTLCHKARSKEDLIKITKLGAEKIIKTLNYLLDEKLIIKANNKYLSIAIRPREELISNYYSELTGLDLNDID